MRKSRINKLNSYYLKIYNDLKKYYLNKQWCIANLVNVCLRFQEANVKDNFVQRVEILHKLMYATASLERFKAQYGDELGQEKYNKYCERQAYTNTQNYKQMSDEEFKKYNKSRAVTLQNMIKKYGDELGQEKYNKYCERQAYTNTLDYFKNKYEDGEKRWKLLNLSKGHSFDSYKLKYINDKDALKYYTIYKSNERSFYSNIASDLFKRIDDYFNNLIKCYYEPKTREFGKFCRELRQYLKYDFVVPELKFCIEFNGDCFHANPLIYEENDSPNPFNKKLKAFDIWNYDKIKNDLIISEGFDLLIIWENDYRKNKDKIFNDIISIIKEKKKNVHS